MHSYLGSQVVEYWVENLIEFNAEFIGEGNGIWMKLGWLHNNAFEWWSKLIKTGGSIWVKLNGIFDKCDWKIR